MSEVPKVVITCKGSDKFPHPEKERMVCRVRLAYNIGEFGVTEIQISPRINEPTFENDFEMGTIIRHQDTPGGATGNVEFDRIELRCPHSNDLTGQKCGVYMPLKNGGEARRKFDQVMLEQLKFASTRPNNSLAITLSDVATKIREAT
jgi:hypothetical protein